MPTISKIRVRYAETDQMGVVYYANYLVWFEIGRADLMRNLGLSYSQLELEHRCIFPVAEASCRYRAPARYDDEIVIETRLALMRGSVIKFGYRILRNVVDQEERKLLAEGETVHVVCDEQLNRCALPEHYETALRSVLDGAESSS